MRTTSRSYAGTTPQPQVVSSPKVAAADIPSAPAMTWTPQPGKSLRVPRAVPFGVTVFYLMIVLSRSLELTLGTLRIPMITLIFLCIGLLLAADMTLRTIATPVFLMLCAFTAWLGVTAVTGVWWSGSFQTLLAAVNTLALVLAIMVFVNSPERLKFALQAIAIGTLIAALQSLAFARDDNARLELSGGSFRDPNEYAIILVLGIPLWLLVISCTRVVLIKLVAIGSILFILRTAIYTGSRGAAIAFGVLLVILFFRISTRAKIGSIVLAPLLFAGIYFVLPEYQKLRYMTIFTSDVQTTDDRIRDQVLGGDLASSESRYELLLNSLRMTFDHPIVGVGPGNFPTENFNRTERETGKKVWLASHNSYTQVSSETGIFGFVLFIALLFNAVRSTQRVLKASKLANPPPILLVECARYLNMAILTLCVGAFFLSIAYDTIIYVLIALATVLERLLCFSTHTPASRNSGTALSGQSEGDPCQNSREKFKPLPSRCLLIGCRRTNPRHEDLMG